MSSNPSLVKSPVITVRPSRPKISADVLPSRRLGPDSYERANGIVFVVGGVLVALSLVGGVWATWNSRQSLGSTTSGGAPVAVSDTALSSTARRAFRPAGTPNPAFVERGNATAVAPLRWEELALMVRTGYTDAEVMQAIAGKQSTFALGPAQEQTLRAAGAGDVLIGYLRSQRVYNAPTAPNLGARGFAPAKVAPAPAAPGVGAANAAPVVDYAARDRQVASLKERMDDLDEEIRNIRLQPNHYYQRWYWENQSDYDYRRDKYIKGLEKSRDELRRQKWQLEGR